MRYIPAIGYAFLALLFVLMTYAGDNTDARALAGIFWLAAIACIIIAIIAAFVAWIV